MLLVVRVKKRFELEGAERERERHKFWMALIELNERRETDRRKELGSELRIGG